MSLTVSQIQNELEFTRYADKLLAKINVASEQAYGETLTPAERVKLAKKLLESRA